MSAIKREISIGNGNLVPKERVRYSEVSAIKHVRYIERSHCLSWKVFCVAANTIQLIDYMNYDIRMLELKRNFVKSIKTDSINVYLITKHDGKIFIINDHMIVDPLLGISMSCLWTGRGAWKLGYYNDAVMQLQFKKIILEHYQLKYIRKCL